MTDDTGAVIAAEDVNVDQEAAAGDDLLAPPEEPAAGRSPGGARRGACDGQYRDAGRGAAGRRDGEWDVVAPECDRAALGANRQRPHRLRLDQLLF